MTSRPPGSTIRNVPARPFTLEIVTEINPTANTKLMGLYRSERHLLHAVRGRRLSAHHLFPRPARRARGLHDAHRGAEVPMRRCSSPTAISSSSGDLAGRPPLRGLARPVPEALLSLRDGRRRSRRRRRQLHHRVRPARSRSASTASTARRTAALYAMDSLKRSMRWDETAFGREYDLDIFMIVAVSDFNMGAMENKGLNIFNDKYVLADPDTATDADFAHVEGVIAHEYFHNWTGNRITCRDWFQLCLKEGPDGLSRPGILVRRCARAAVEADRRRAHAAGAAIPRGCRSPRPSGAARRSITRSTTSTRRRSTRRAPRSSACCRPSSARTASARAWTSTSTATTARRSTIEDFLAAFADATGADLTQFKLWYSQAGTPEVTAKGSYDREGSTYTLTLSQTVPADAGPERSSSRCTSRCASASIGPNGDDLAYYVGIRRGASTAT